MVDCERLCVGIYIQGSFHSLLNIRVTELPLSACRFYSTEAPNVRFSLAPLSPGLRQQSGINPNSERQRRIAAHTQQTPSRRNLYQGNADPGADNGSRIFFNEDEEGF